MGAVERIGIGSKEELGDLISPPVIIHGAGRSGSTLLSCLLRGHQDFYMPDELSFLVPRLYNEIINKTPFLTNWLALSQKLGAYNRSWGSVVLSSSSVNKEETKQNEEVWQEWRQIATHRIQLEIGKFVRSLLIPPSHTYRHWGFKEIWNGSPSFNYPWTIYKNIFGSPSWIHIVRHPADFIRSMAGHRGEESPTEKFVTDNLRYWVAINEKSLMLSDEQNFLVRYEDLVSNPDKVVAEIAAFVGMKYDPSVLRLMEKRYVQGKVRSKQICLSDETVGSTPGLRELCEIFDYKI